MKALIIGVCTVLLYCLTTVMVADMNAHKRQNEYLKYVCEQTAHSASTYYVTSEYGEGRKVFNQTEGIKIIEHQMKYLLNLDNGFTPAPDTYWQDNVTYKAYFFDDSNTTYPYDFIDDETGFSKTIKEPTVIVTINAGKARYKVSLIPSTGDNIRSAAYEWQER